MKILRLRTHYGIPALKGENSWGAADPGTELRMVQGGNFVVSKYGKHVLIPGQAIVSADVEPGDTLPLGVAVVDEAKRGPGRPKKEPVPSE